MGKKYVIDETTLTNIADYMRSITYSEEKIYPEDMPREMDKTCIYVYDIGFVEGADNQCHDMLGGAW